MGVFEGVSDFSNTSERTPSNCTGQQRLNKMWPPCVLI